MASTPNFAWPTPDDTDPVGDGALDMRTLGNSIDSTLGSAWIAYTPTLTQTVTVTKTIVVARYKKIGKTVTAQIILTCTSSGTNGTMVSVGLPIAGTNDRPLGSFLCIGGPSHFGNRVGMAITNSTTTAGGFLQDGVSNWFGVNPAFQLLTGDSLYLNITYEAA
jgi:hypothetical protein